MRVNNKGGTQIFNITSIFSSQDEGYKAPSPKPLLCIEHVGPFCSDSEVRFNMKEGVLDSCSIVPSIEDVEFHVISHNRIFQPHASMSRKEVEEQTWRNATHFFYQTMNIEVSPPKMNINGLYIFITDSVTCMATHKHVLQPTLLSIYLMLVAQLIVQLVFYFMFS